MANPMQDKNQSAQGNKQPQQQQRDAGSKPKTDKEQQGNASSNFQGSSGNR